MAPMKPNPRMTPLKKKKLVIKDTNLGETADKMNL